VLRDGRSDGVRLLCERRQPSGLDAMELLCGHTELPEEALADERMHEDRVSAASDEPELLQPRDETLEPRRGESGERSRDGLARERDGTDRRHRGARVERREARHEVTFRGRKLASVLLDDCSQSTRERVVLRRLVEIEVLERSSVEEGGRIRTGAP